MSAAPSSVLLPAPPSLMWDDVNEGDKLPDLEFGPMTLRTFQLMFAGSRDPNPQHYQRDWNRETGSRDMFATTPWHQALFARYATDWTGPESDFRGATLGMGTQVCPGDTLKIEGTVAKKWVEGDDHRVLIEMTSTSQLGRAATASATMAMPSREHGQVKVVTDVAKMAVDPHPEMPDWAKAGLGKVSPRSGPTAFPVSEIQLWYWTEMVENANPLYTNPEYAKASRHGGIIAPGPSLMVWTFGHPGRTNDVDNESHKPWPPVEETASGGGGGVTPPGTTNVVATNAVHEYGVPMRPGDYLYTEAELVNCTPLKRTHLGEGFFVTNLTTYYNQRDEIVASALFTLYQYTPHKK